MLGSRRRRNEDYVPLAYFGLALALALGFLPSILRQSSRPQNQSAALSPDAPPDRQRSIIAAFNRAASGTAGSGTGQGAGADAGGSPDVTPTTTPQPGAKRSCRFGYGNPPMTSSSPYAAPCVAAWSGNNGGATWKGVTPTEVRVAVGYANGSVGTNGWVPTTPQPNESDADRTWRLLQAWFNSRYEFYGRQLRLYVYNYGEDTASQQQAAADVDAHGVFAASMGRWNMMSELARRQIIAWGEEGDQYPEQFLTSHRPYNWESAIDAHRASLFAAEYICKKLWGKPAKFAGDPLTQSQKRVLGIIYNDNGGYHGINQDLQDALKADCNADVATSVGFSGDTYGWSDPAQVSTAVTRLRQSGVTTVIQLLDMDTTGLVTNEADSQGYNPEWFVTGVWLADDPSFAKLQNSHQWAHAFGLTAREIDSLATEHPGYRAYKDMDPAGTPDSNIVCCVFWGLEQIANGIQLAGPHLTPDTFEKGLTSMGRRQPNPLWAMGGGFGPDDHSFADLAAEIWWNPTASSLDGSPGAYMFVRDGKRYSLGSLPTEEPLVFQDGTSSAELRRRSG